MPVVIKRSDPGGSGDKPAKSAAKNTKSAPGKSSGKAKQAGAAGLSLENQRIKIIGLSTIIVLSLLFIAWWIGLFGGSGPAPATTSNSTTTSASGTAGSPGTVAAPGATLGTQGTGAGAPAGGRMGGGVMSDSTGAAGARGNSNDPNSQGEGIP